MKFGLFYEMYVPPADLADPGAEATVLGRRKRQQRDSRGRKHDPPASKSHEKSVLKKTNALSYNRPAAAAVSPP